MTLQEAADHLGVTKKKLWRAIKADQLEAFQVQNGQRWEYRVSPESLEKYQRSLTSELGGTDAERLSRSASQDVPERDGAFPTETERGTRYVPTEMERDGTSQSSPPAEVYIALIDRLSRAERRTVELELTLRQSQRLLAENAESLTEKEALVKEANAKQDEIERLETLLRREEQSREAETAKLRAELESTRSQLAESQKPKGFLSWLGLRKSRTSVSNDNDKAV